jgi:hypothetical protein
MRQSCDLETDPKNLTVVYKDDLRTLMQGIA